LGEENIEMLEDRFFSLSFSVAELSSFIDSMAESGDNHVGLCAAMGTGELATS
jgi:hypothetical protein